MRIRTFLRSIGIVYLLQILSSGRPIKIHPSCFNLSTVNSCPAGKNTVTIAADVPRNYICCGVIVLPLLYQQLQSFSRYCISSGIGVVPSHQRRQLSSHYFINICRRPSAVISTAAVVLPAVYQLKYRRPPETSKGQVSCRRYIKNVSCPGAIISKAAVLY